MRSDIFLFFVVIEGVFRGWLLHACRDVCAEVAGPAWARTGAALTLAGLPYVVWHLGKPEAELWGTLIWAFLAGYAILRSGSIWGVCAVHWGMNVVIDAVSLGMGER